MIPVKPHVAAEAQVNSLEQYHELYRRSLADPEGFWREQSGLLEWFYPPRAVFDADPQEVDFSWFSGGRLNACYNCVDRHLGAQGDKTALLWAGDEPGEYRRISYRELKHNVARVANVLRAHGVKKGDRVCVYLPMVPEVVYTMLACARIGAVHSVVFAGFSAESLRDRILDAGCRVVVTANEGLRGGRGIPLKHTVDQAVEGLSLVERVLVVRRTAKEVPMRAGRDLWLSDEMARQRSTCPVEWMAAEDPLFILYTSGSTGKPKGVLHTTGGYLVYVALTHQYVFDYHDGDVYWCTADVGWVTGHSYILYGPLANGAITLIFEGVPNYPTASRFWEVIDK
ncbi:MAG TPA: AMP-binding protein, partial [Thermoanaerobaculia bacterium]|nr:AMP-binding protein [Thermoanaerobaculia bacterium]